MIRALTPDQVAWAMEKVYREGMSKTRAAQIIKVRRHTLVRALKEAPVHGFMAFSLTMLRERAQKVCEGKTLAECHRALFDAGLHNPTSHESLRNSLRNAGIEYVQIGYFKDHPEKRKYNQ